MKELGIRKVLGSRRMQLAFQFFTESLVITCIAAFFAITFVLLALPFFNSISGKEMYLGQLIQMKPILGFISIILTCALLSSFYPAVFISNIKPVAIFQLKNSGIGKGNRFRKTMLMLQVVTSCILLIFTFIFFKQLQFMENYALGFQKEQVMVVEVKARESRSKIPEFKNELLKLSSVVSVALTGQIPGGENIKTEPMSFESNEGAYSEILTNYMFAGPDLIPTLNCSWNRVPTSMQQKAVQIEVRKLS